MNLQYKFSIDTFSPILISGWCFYRLYKSKPVTLVFTQDKTVLGECVANLLREDVKAQKLHPSGLCGFSFFLPESFQSSKSDDVTISIKESTAKLYVLKKEYVGRVIPDPQNFLGRIRRWIHRQKDSKKRVFFMHIPKTAGTSFNSFARSLYNPDEILTHIESFHRSEYPAIANNYSFISGHLQLSEIKEFFPHSEFQLYSLIREPYSHLHSHLNWLRSIGADKNGPLYLAQHQLFKDLTAEFGKKSQLDYDNLQKIVDNLTGVLRKSVDNSQIRYFLDNTPEIVDISCFDRAKEDLALFKSVGLTAKYSLFRETFCKDNSFVTPKTAHSLNKSRFTPLYDHRDPLNREIVHPLVKVDLLLYHLVLDRTNLSSTIH